MIILNKEQLLSEGVPFEVFEGQFKVNLSAFNDGRPLQSFHWPFMVSDRRDGPTGVERCAAAAIVVELCAKAGGTGELQFVEGLHFQEGEDVSLVEGEIVERLPVPFLLEGAVLSGYPAGSRLAINLIGVPVAIEEVMLTDPTAELEFDVPGLYRMTIWPSDQLRYKHAEFEIENPA